MLGLAAIVAEICLYVSYPSIARHILFMLGLISSAYIVGAIPRKARTKQDQIVCSIIGWPMLLTFLALIAVSVRAMLEFGAPEYLLLIGFLWVLALLTWKLFLHPTTNGSNSN